MRAFVILSIICCLGTMVFGQQNRIRWEESQQLQWDDFAGKVNDTSWFDAECFAEIGYRYRLDKTRRFRFDVFANFIKDVSWTKKEYQSPSLLKHEQLHFDIAELFSMKMQEMFQNYHYTENYEAEIQQLFDDHKEKYHLMQQIYDDETNHSINKLKQKEWESFITSELIQMKLKRHKVSREVKRNNVVFLLMKNCFNIKALFKKCLGEKKSLPAATAMVIVISSPFVLPKLYRYLS